ncbi:F-box domain-containing protein [Mycena kentingensis (nom. inval.)]|nr:F-box domain-containing protein [Mycena kentingensis (nom. inval.)]
MQFTAIDRAADRIRIPQSHAEIAQLEVTLATTRLSDSERDAAQQQLDTPVDSIPNELISAILLHCIPVYPRCPALVGAKSPTKLGQICRLWRQIAHSTPALWRGISISGWSPLRVDTVPLVHTWLARSGALPLSIVLDVGSVLPEAVTAVMYLLNEHRERWEHMVLDLDENPKLLPMFFPSPAPRLQELDLRYGVGPLVVSAPNLRIAHLESEMTGEMTRIDLPWHQLSRLCIHATTVELLRVLPETTSVAHLQLFLQSQESTSGIIAARVTLPSLETLIVMLHDGSELYDDDGNGQNYGPFLQCLRAPVLQHLYIEADLLEARPESRLDAVVSLVSGLGSDGLQNLRVAYTAVGILDQYQEALPKIPDIAVAIEDLSDFLDAEGFWGVWDLRATYMA